MARIPSIKRIAAEDFPDQKWISKLLQPLNTFMSEVVAALNKNITIADNLLGQIVTVKAVGTATSATFAPVQFRSTVGKPAGLWIVNQRDTASNPSVNEDPVGLDWSYDYATDLVTINYVSGLTPSVQYNITLIALGG